MKRLVRWLLRIHTTKFLVLSAVLTLVALALMIWSMAKPTPLPVMLAMTVGQALGTLAFALYGLVVALDLFQRRRADEAIVVEETPVPSEAAAAKPEPSDKSSEAPDKPSSPSDQVDDAEAKP